MGENVPRLDGWIDFAGKFLKAEFVKTVPVILICKEVEAYFDDDDDAHLLLHMDYNMKKWKWEANKTNQKIFRAIQTKPLLFL